MSEQNYFGGDLSDPEDLSAMDRGDDFAPTADVVVPEAPAPVAAPEPAAPENPEPEPAPAGDEPEAANAAGQVDRNLIPRSRFNEVNEAKRAAERRAAELEAQLNRSAPAASDFDFDAKEREYMEAVLEGETDKALGIRREIRHAELTQHQTAAAQIASQTQSEARAALEHQQVVEELTASYPVFDTTSPAYDQDIVDEVLGLQAGLVARKFAPADALRKAVSYVAAAHGLQSAGAPTPTPTAPARGAPNVQSKLDLATSQPPMQAGTSGGATAPSPADMTDEDWEKLPASTIARLRGDFV